MRQARLAPPGFWPRLALRIVRGPASVFWVTAQLFPWNLQYCAASEEIFREAAEKAGAPGLVKTLPDSAGIFSHTASLMHLVLQSGNNRCIGFSVNSCPRPH
jgi:hypothetical protein